MPAMVHIGAAYTIPSIILSSDVQMSSLKELISRKFVYFTKNNPICPITRPPFSLTRPFVRDKIPPNAGVVELVDSLDLGSNARACRFESCHPHQKSTPKGCFFIFHVLQDKHLKLFFPFLRLVLVVPYRPCYIDKKQRKRGHCICEIFPAAYPFCCFAF